MSNCQLCGEPMPDGEEMFNFHGYSGPCPKPPLSPAESELDKLRRFKAYVHARLDAMGVPENPDGVHGKEGCRVGDRLDIVAAAFADAERWRALRDGKFLSWGVSHWNPAQEVILAELPLNGEPVWSSVNEFDYAANLTRAIDAAIAKSAR